MLYNISNWGDCLNNYKFCIAYDGSRYSGWQRQGNTGTTIQNKLERVLSSLVGEEISISGSGRTDAGVHAVGQIANFKTNRYLDTDSFADEVNRMLPEDIAVSDFTLASPRFHARLSAKEKTYRYTIQNDIASDVFHRKYEYRIPDALDIAAMRQAAQYLEGTHDFIAFSSGRTKKSTVRHIRKIDIQQDGTKLFLTFTGNGFLYNMVRILVGTLIEVGKGQRSPESIPAAIESKDRSQAGFTAPPQGLCLMEVYY